MRRVLVVISGPVLAAFAERVLRVLTWSDAELYLLHVVDTQPLVGYGLAADALPGRGGLARPRLHAMKEAAAEAGRRMLEEGEAVARSLLPPEVSVHRLRRFGVPGPEIVAAAQEVGAHLVVLEAATMAPQPGPSPPPPSPRGSGGPSAGGPRHLGPIARFVVDHAPCDVLLLYGGGPGEDRRR